MPIAASFLKAVRLTHKYLGVFVAPAVIFFAFTGALQTFSLHETSKGSDYKPAHWILVLSRIHKDQTPVIPPPRPKPAAEAPKAEKHHEDAPIAPIVQAAAQPVPAPMPKKHNALPLKIFFLIVSISLIFSTLTGLYMAYKYAGNKVAITLTLLAGIVIPVLMLVL